MLSETTTLLLSFVSVLLAFSGLAILAFYKTPKMLAAPSKPAVLKSTKRGE